jgi:hypothetical protein
MQKKVLKYVNKIKSLPAYFLSQIETIKQIYFFLHKSELVFVPLLNCCNHLMVDT